MFSPVTTMPTFNGRFLVRTTEEDNLKKIKPLIELLANGFDEVVAVQLFL